MRSQRGKVKKVRVSGWGRGGRGGLFPLKICKYKTNVTLGVFGEKRYLTLIRSNILNKNKHKGLCKYYRETLSSFTRGKIQNRENIK